MKAPVKPAVFEAMQTVDIDALAKFSESELRPVLPGLVRMALCSPLDISDRGIKLRKSTLIILSGLEVVNNIVGLLSIDFNALEQDVRKEIQLRGKASGTQTESVLIMQLTRSLTHEFEQSDAARRIRLILSQLLFVVSELKDGKTNYRKSSDLFESPVYMEEVSDILCIAHAELPGLLQLGEVAEALLCLPNGPEMLCQLVANFPESFMEVCSSLVSHGEKVEEDSTSGCRRLEMLLMLTNMNCKDALSIRALCVEHCTMPGLAVALSLQMTATGASQASSDDVISFITSLLLGSDPAVRNWFSLFVKSAQKRVREFGNRVSVLHELRQYLLQRLKELSPVPGETLAECAVVRTSALVRLYSALKGIATLKYTDEEMKYLLQILTSQPPLSHSGTRFVTLAVSVIISSSHLLAGLDEEQQMILWIRKLLEREKEFEKEASGVTSFGEMLFLVALHFHSNQMAAISELVCNTLGMKSIVKTSSLSRLRQIFTQEIFTEQVIAAHAVKIPVTPGLNATHTGYLPLHSIHQLLKSRVFSRHKVPIKDWILRQLKQSTLPLHPLLPQLIECFVSTILPKGLKADHLVPPFDEREILSVYSDFLSSKSSEAKQVSKHKSLDEGDNLAPQLLMLYYVLLYLDTSQSVTKSPVLSLRPHNQLSEAMLAQIPINYLVQEAQRRQQQCVSIFPALLRLLVSHFPHLCLVEDWLEDSLAVTRSSPSSSSSLMVAAPPAPTTSGLPLTQVNFKGAMQNVVTNPALAVSQLTALLRQSPVSLQQFADPLVQCLPLLLDPQVPRKVLDLTQRVWFKCHSLTPRRLRLATVNALQSKLPGVKLDAFQEQDVIIDPLVVLRCDERVFRCPSILAIVLRLLAAYLQASRLYLHQQVINSASIGSIAGYDAAKIEKERLELKNALVAAQDAACLQILLEICLPLPEERAKKEGELTSLREVRCAIFSFLHQAFIQDPNLAKLIHFMGYPSELIPLMVAGVPSMHICLDYIEEMLKLPETERQVFAIQLLAALCGQYSLAKTMKVARQVINFMFTIFTAYESKVACQMFIETVPCLLLICRAFPPLCSDITSLLIQVARVCRSHITISTNVIVADFVETDGPKPKIAKLVDETVLESSVDFQRLYSIVQDTFQQIGLSSISGRL